MNSEEKRAILDNYPSIMTTLKIGYESLLDWLIQGRIIHLDDKDEVECRQTPRKKVEKILEYVLNSDHPQAFSIFVNAVRQSFPYLAKALEDSCANNMKQEVQSQPQNRPTVACQTGGFYRKPRQETQLQQPAQNESKPSYNLVENDRKGGQENNCREAGADGTSANQLSIEHPIQRSAYRSVKAGFKPPWQRQSGDPPDPPIDSHQKAVDECSKVQEMSASSKNVEGPSQRKRPSMERQSAVLHSDQSVDDLHAAEAAKMLEELSVNPDRNARRKDPATAVGNHGISTPSLTSPNETYRCTLKRFTEAVSFGFKFVSARINNRTRFPGDSSFYICHIDPYSIADCCDRLTVKDTIVSVNGKKVDKLDYDEVADIFRKALEVDLVMQSYTPPSTRL